MLHGRVLRVEGGAYNTEYGLRLRVSRGEVPPLAPPGGPYQAVCTPGEATAPALNGLKTGDPVSFTRRADHPQDSRAIEVHSSTGLSLGLLSWSQAFHLAPLMDAGHQLYGRIPFLAGGRTHLLVGWYEIDVHCSGYTVSPLQHVRFADYDGDLDYLYSPSERQWTSSLRDDYDEDA